MNGLQTRTAERDKLLEQINRIERELKSRLDKKNELNEQSSQADRLRERINRLERDIQTGSNVDPKITSSIERAIKSQRWFRFENKPHVIFDRDTALLWADLDHFPYLKDKTSGLYRPTDIAALIHSTNAQSIDGYRDWAIPTPDELWQMIEDKTFPYQFGAHWRICKIWAWYVNYNGKYLSKDMDERGAVSGIEYPNAAVIPCSHALVSTGASTLEIFINNDLVPIFDTDSINTLYRQLDRNNIDRRRNLDTLRSELDAARAELSKNAATVDKASDEIAQLEIAINNTRALLDSMRTRLAAAQLRIERYPTVYLLATPNGYRTLLKSFDISAIDRSLVEYREAVTSLASTFLDRLDEFEAEEYEVVRALESLDFPTMRPTDDPDVRSILEARRKYFSARFELDLERVRRRLELVKSEGESLGARLDSCHDGGDCFRKLAELSGEPRAEFEFVASTLAYTLRAELRKVEFFDGHRELVVRLAKLWRTWESKPTRTGLERAFLPLVELTVERADTEEPLRALEALTTYREAVSFVDERRALERTAKWLRETWAQIMFEWASTATERLRLARVTKLIFGSTLEFKDVGAYQASVVELIRMLS